MITPIDESTFWVDAPGFISHKVKVRLGVSCGKVKKGVAIDSIQVGDPDRIFTGGVISLEDLKEIVRLAEEANDHGRV